MTSSQVQLLEEYRFLKIFYTNTKKIIFNYQNEISKIRNSSNLSNDEKLLFDNNTNNNNSFKIQLLTEHFIKLERLIKAYMKISKNPEQFLCFNDDQKEMTKILNYNEIVFEEEKKEEEGEDVKKPKEEKNGQKIKIYKNQEVQTLPIDDQYSTKKRKLDASESSESQPKKKSKYLPNGQMKPPTSLLFEYCQDRTRRYKNPEYSFAEFSNQVEAICILELPNNIIIEKRGTANIYDNKLGENSISLARQKAKNNASAKVLKYLQTKTNTRNIKVSDDDPMSTDYVRPNFRQETVEISDDENNSRPGSSMSVRTPNGSEYGKENNAGFELPKNIPSASEFSAMVNNFKNIPLQDVTTSKKSSSRKSTARFPSESSTKSRMIYMTQIPFCSGPDLQYNDRREVYLDTEIDLIEYLMKNYGMVYDISFVNSNKMWVDSKTGTKKYYTSALIEMNENVAEKLVNEREIREEKFGVGKVSVRLKVKWSHVNKIEDGKRRGSKIYLAELAKLIHP